jgi:hypothetical protein
MDICLYARSLIARIHQYAPKLERLFSERRKIFYVDQNPEKTVMRSRSGEDGFCSSETEHDRRMSRRARLFVLARNLEERTTNPKTALRFLPDAGVFSGDNLSCYVQV